MELEDNRINEMTNIMLSLFNSTINEHTGIDEEIIEKASQMYPSVRGDLEKSLYNDGCFDGFVAGAKWMYAKLIGE